MLLSLFIKFILIHCILVVFLTMSSSLSESSITAFLGLTVLRFLYRIAVLLIIPDYRGKEINILTFPPVSGFALPRALAGVERGVETGVDTIIYRINRH